MIFAILRRRELWRLKFPNQLPILSVAPAAHQAGHVINSGLARQAKPALLADQQCPL